MNRFFMVALLGVAFVIGITSIAVTVWPQISIRTETAALMKEVP